MSWVTTILSWVSSFLGWLKPIITPVAPAPVVADVDDVTKVLSALETALTNARSAWSSQTVSGKIVDAETVALQIEKIAAVFYPPAALAEVPTQTLIVLTPYLAKLIGLVQDSQGIFAPPPTNSKYDPTTGNFLPGQSWL